MEGKCESSRLVVPNDRSYVPVARAYVEGVGRKLGFEDDELEMIGRATTEAAGNVIEHAFGPQERQTFEIGCERVPGGLRVTVRDRGMPLDSLRLAQDLLQWEHGGRLGLGPGFSLMRELMDEVSVHNLGREGKEVVLVKYLRNRAMDDYFQACALEAFEPPATVRPLIAEKMQFRVRLMKPSDAVEVARCVYKAYGYSYFSPQVYYPERLIEYMESGSMIAAVALTKDGDLAGHCALFRSDPGSPVAELQQAVVKPEYRGQGCLLALTEFLVNEAASRGMTGLNIWAVTNHTFSQRVAARLGFNACGVLLAYGTSTISYKQIREHLRQRETYLLTYRYLEKPASLTLYPPARHRDFIERLYGNLGVTPNFADAGQCSVSLADSPSVLETKAGAVEPQGTVSIEVKTYGKDLVLQVRARTRELCLQRYDVIELLLDLADPITCVMTTEFEKLGYFVGGILPGESGRDTLILQFLNNMAIDYGKIELHSEMGLDILEYIRRHDPNVRLGSDG